MDLCEVKNETINNIEMASKEMINELESLGNELEGISDNVLNMSPSDIVDAMCKTKSTVKKLIKFVKL